MGLLPENIHLIKEPLKLAKCGVITRRGPADGDHGAHDVEGIVERIDEDEPVHRVPEVAGEAEGGDDGDDAKSREGRGRPGDDAEDPRLLGRQVDITPCVQHSVSSRGDTPVRARRRMVALACITIATAADVGRRGGRKEIRLCLCVFVGVLAGGI